MSSTALQAQLETTVSETSPLLNQSSAAADYHAADDFESQKLKDRRLHNPTPIPRTQLASLCVVRFAEPINFTQIFPYVNEQIKNLHICDPQSVGVYSGIIESSFAIAQVISVMEWAKLSDRIGRRPVVLIGTVGVMLTTLMFGLGRSFWTLVLSRALAGIFCGNVAVLQSVLGEITDATNQATAFPLFAMTWPVGIIIGPLIGGSLSKPATKFPAFNNEFFRTYPYFLPSFAAATISLIGATLGYLFLKETLPSKMRKLHRRDRTNSSVSSSASTLVEVEGLAEEVAPPPPSPSSIRDLLQIPTIRALSSSGCALAFISAAFDVVFVLFAYSPIENGGLALPDQQIGYTLAIAGCIAASIQLVLLPTLLRTFDVGKMYGTCVYIFPVAFILMPVLNVIARTSLSSNGHLPSSTLSLIWVGIAIDMMFSRIGNVAFSLSMILTKQHAPTADSLGSVNGLVQWCMCLARAFAPAAVSSTFALSQSYNLMNGHLWALLFAFIAFTPGILARGVMKSTKEMK